MAICINLDRAILALSRSESHALLLTETNAMFQSISDIGVPIVSNPADADQVPDERTLVTSMMTRHTPSQDVKKN